MKNSLRSIAIIVRPTTPKPRGHGKGWLARLASIKRKRFSLCQTSWRGFTFSAIDLDIKRASHDTGASGGEDTMKELAGTYSLISSTRKLVETGEVFDTWGKNPNGFITYGKDGRMLVLIVSDSRPKPESLAKMTDQQQADLFRTMCAYGGTYKFDGARRLLSFPTRAGSCRELLYTALTRHQGRLVVLHQGPLADYRGLAGDEHSEIARRVTNLFVNPTPREVTVGSQQRFLEEGLIHRTERGDLVRSK